MILLLNVKQSAVRFCQQALLAKHELNAYTNVRFVAISKQILYHIQYFVYIDRLVLF